MQFGAIALVLVETIFGKLRAEVTHDSVARDFGDHARGRDRQTIAITIDDGGLRKWKRKNGKTVDQHVLRRNCECGERDAHRFVRCPQNIDPVDFKVIDHADAPCDLGV